MPVGDLTDNLLVRTEGLEAEVEKEDLDGGAPQSERN